MNTRAATQSTEHPAGHPAEHPTGTAETVPLPGALRIGLSRGVIELKQFFRQVEFVVFTFSMPAILLLLLGSVFNDTNPATGVSASHIFTASMVGAGIISTSFINMGIGITLDRQTGTLKRLRGTPMPASSYFIGKIILVAVASTAQVVVLLAVGATLFGLTLPTGVYPWLTFAWVFLLGIISCGLLGIAISGLTRNVNSAAAATNIIFIALAFTSGVFITISDLPHGMISVSSVLPVKWIAQGMRSVFLPEAAAVQEMAGSWELGLTALILGTWCVAGFVLAKLMFRWTTERA